MAMADGTHAGRFTWNYRFYVRFAIYYLGQALSVMVLSSSQILACSTWNASASEYPKSSAKKLDHCSSRLFWSQKRECTVARIS